MKKIFVTIIEKDTETEEERVVLAPEEDGGYEGFFFYGKVPSDESPIGFNTREVVMEISTRQIAYMIHKSATLNRAAKINAEIEAQMASLASHLAGDKEGE